MLDREKETERDAVGGVEEETERDRVHEGNVGEVELLPHSRAIVVVPAEGNAGAGGRKLADEGRGPADQPESPGSRPADQLNGGKQKGSEKDEDVGAEEDGFEER